jgi:hypothetical protein
MNRRAVSFGPWSIAALIWGLFSYVIINEHFRISDGSHWQELWFLCSLVWFQFGFAMVLISIFRKQFFLIKDQLLVALLPPVLLYFLWLRPAYP